MAKDVLCMRSVTSCLMAAQAATMHGACAVGVLKHIDCSSTRLCVAAPCSCQLWEATRSAEAQSRTSHLPHLHDVWVYEPAMVEDLPLHIARHLRLSTCLSSVAFPLPKSIMHRGHDYGILLPLVVVSHAGLCQHIRSLGAGACSNPAMAWDGAAPSLLAL